MKADLTVALFAALLAWQAASAQTLGAAPSPAAPPVQRKLETANPPGNAPLVGATQTPGAGGCAKCSATATSVDQALQAAASRPIPGSNETMLVGRVENLIPIGVLSVLGCENCSAEAVNWALQQGSSFDDIERALRTVAAMRKLDCFKRQFGPEVASRMEKPLAAAMRTLEQARTRPAK